MPAIMKVVYIYIFFHFKELQKLKAQVVTEIRSNKQLEQDLHGMDIKIGLLVRNKITLQVREPAIPCNLVYSIGAPWDPRH